MAERKRITRAEEMPESGTVTVCCNLPNGLALRIFDMEEHYEDVLGGGQRKTSIAVQSDDRIIKINGTAFHPRRPAKHLIIDGYALTNNVDAQFMAAWFAQNERNPLVKNFGIYALRTDADAQDWAHDHAGTKSGLEPLDMENGDKRVPKSITRDTDAKAA